jgi:hypothetical protein
MNRWGPHPHKIKVVKKNSNIDRFILMLYKRLGYKRVADFKTMTGLPPLCLLNARIFD